MGERTCSVDGCGERVNARGWCSTHYSRWRKHGSLEPARIHGDDEKRFWSKVDRRGDDECWPWLGGLTEDGYGRFRVAGKLAAAHRYAYELLVGPIPEGLTIDHVRAKGCVRRDCVNPRHLEPVLLAENIRRGDSPSARWGQAAACKNGHEYTLENTYVKPGTPGWRLCRACRNEYERRKRQERRTGP